MFSAKFRQLLHTLGLCLLLLPPAAQAQSVVAEGRGAIIGNDLESARRAAIRDATEQASLQAAAYISVTQQVTDGVLEIDNLHLGAQGNVGNIQLLDEKRQGNWLLVRIRADIDTEPGCEKSAGHAYRNRLAVTSFPLLQPQQANLGQLHGIDTLLPSLIARELALNPGLRSADASRTRIIQDPATAPTRRLPDGSLDELVSVQGQPGVQYLVSGVIRDLSMQHPELHGEQNLLKHWYNRARKQDERYLRTLALELYVHDALTGALLFRQQYRTEGLWSLPPEQATGFATAAFWQQDFGLKTRALLDSIGLELGEELSCLPFRARILKVEQDRVWFNAGEDAGIARGDRLSLYRLDNRFGPRLDNSRTTLVVDDIQAGTASGTFSGSAEQFNIQVGDIVMAQ
ncbi:flagellar assembly protein T N-terminal domain-containing protein [Marinobacterium aestuariivivens]|uniref:Flagellar assembly protein T N-terminal domain-containing protein n=1 Tax=Marinobacterium aestuariivivens TaxID=1698799 RepID=A0ABW1ZXW7_9GAMM